MDDFVRVLLSYNDRIFNVIDPSRNFGDLLICKGMIKMLKKSCIKYKLYKYKTPNDIITRLLWTIIKFIESFPKMGIPHDICKKLTVGVLQSLLNYYYVNRCKIDFDEDEVILIQGGGDFNDMVGSYGIRLLKTILRYCPKNTLIIAPQSYYFKIINFAKLFTKHKGKAYLFCREKFSYNLLRSMKFPQNVKILLSRDTAFYATEDMLYIKNRANNANRFSHDLLAFREDIESIINDKVKKLIKMKILGERRFIESDISKKAKDLSEFLSLILQSERIYTDRLHVGIVAALFGKKVFLFPCCYWKTKGVYLFNLKDYNNVVYIDEYYLDKPDKLVNLLSQK